MIVNPGIRRFLGSAIQRLFNSASFSAPLTHSLVPERGTGSPTFTRASTATVMGYGPTDNAVDGLKLLTVAANEARFVGARRISEGVWSNTFADGSLIPAATNTGYLAEGARTNLCLQSQTFDNASWVAANSGGTAPVVTPNASVAPDGTLTADRIAFSTQSAGSYNLVFQGINVTAAAHAASLYVKLVAGSPTVWVSATPDGVTYLRQSVVPTGDWQRVEFAGTTAAVIWYFGIGVDLRDGSQTAQAAFTIAVWGAQVELGSSASTYIPTTTAAVTRAAGVDAYPTASNILAAASTVYLEFTPDHTPSGTIALWGTYVDASNYTAILHDATNMIMRKRIAGVNYDAAIANAFTANTTYKVCGSWGASGVTVTLDGTEGTPHANTTAAQIAATMQVGADGNSLQQPGAGTTNLRIWQRQLSSPEGVAVTA